MSASTERAILAGSCFWGMQDLFRRQAGILHNTLGEQSKWFREKN
jgi:peptide-methionine (S)-S-oxide reductase